MRASVVFPDPDSPMIVKISDASRQREVGVHDRIDMATRQLASDHEALEDVGDLEQRAYQATSGAMRSLSTNATSGSSFADADVRAQRQNAYQAAV